MARARARRRRLHRRRRGERPGGRAREQRGHRRGHRVEHGDGVLPLDRRPRPASARTPRRDARARDGSGLQRGRAMAGIRARSAEAPGGRRRRRPLRRRGASRARGPTTTPPAPPRSCRSAARSANEACAPARRRPRGLLRRGARGGGRHGLREASPGGPGRQGHRRNRRSRHGRVACATTRSRSSAPTRRRSGPIYSRARATQLTSTACARPEVASAAQTGGPSSRPGSPRSTSSRACTPTTTGRATAWTG